MQFYLRSALIVLGLLVLQTTFIQWMELGGIVPDILLVWLISLAITRGQIEATVAGFAVGLLQDAASTQFFGLAALTKTVSGFLAGYFYNENKTKQTLGTYRFIVITMACSLAHNLLYFGIFFQGTGGSVLEPMIRYAVATTTYTGAVSALPMFAFSRKFLTT
jgi:rod shape-determining protein MreD